MMMKLWIDDIRPAPDGFIWCKSVNQAKAAITAYEHQYSYDNILIDLDHDAGDYFNDGGDYFKILDWLEEKNIVTRILMLISSDSCLCLINRFTPNKSIRGRSNIINP